MSRKALRVKNGIMHEIEKKKTTQYIKNILKYTHYPKGSNNYGKNNAIWVSINYAEPLKILHMTTGQILDLKKSKEWRASLVVQCNSEDPVVYVVLTYCKDANYESYYWMRDRIIYRYDITNKKCTRRKRLLSTDERERSDVILDEKEWVPDSTFVNMIQSDIVKADIRLFISYRNLINKFWKKKRIWYYRSGFNYIIHLPREVLERILDYFDDKEGIFVSYVNVTGSS